MGLQSRFKKTILSLLLFACTSFTAANAAVIELALVLDGSGSISSSEFALQTGAYNNIFSSGTFFDDFVNAGDELHVAAYQFSSSSNATLEIPWTMLGGNMAASAFGNAFAGISQIGGATNTSGAVNTAVAGIMGNGIAGDRLIIDVSTDGQPNNGGGQAGANAAAANALAAGVTVNAIGVGSGIGVPFLTDFSNAGGGFFLTADDFGQFQSVLERKLRREITEPPTSVPEPASMLLLGIGMLGLGAARRKKLI